ncbi:hypothetical protein J1N35_036499 [Gossypium stocksii]|uniref:Endonuclease/exonuclease/phosphatase domain-containing protein n=1 Tax=Gossypium stocksii TaxID=47602 RepID=A0A9D3UI18_9ROSI|nr:hypothetical protein J1N35_036499 [Gossypium stocksii]
MHQKHLLKKKLDNVQKAMDRRRLTFLNQVKLEIREKLELVLHQEELLWHQKARCDWLVLGDCNTRFFHRKTLQKRKHNHIVALKNQAGEWVMDEDELKQKTVNFYRNLYGEQPRDTSRHGCSTFQPLEMFLAVSAHQPLFGSLQAGDEEWLRHVIHVAIADGSWSPIRLTRSGSLHAWMELNLRNQQVVKLASGVNWSCLLGIII